MFMDGSNMKTTILNTNPKLEKLIQTYFDKIDDYYEAKDEFIKDVNAILQNKGDTQGVMCRHKFACAFADTRLW